MAAKIKLLDIYRQIKFYFRGPKYIPSRVSHNGYHEGLSGWYETNKSPAESTRVICCIQQPLSVRRGKWFNKLIKGHCSMFILKLLLFLFKTLKNVEKARMFDADKLGRRSFLSFLSFHLKRIKRNAVIEVDYNVLLLISKIIGFQLFGSGEQILASG